jgi:ectoine hydroxylase-related dioxygenase (phytanoyl-CoA dioxygenase family)
VTDPREIFDRDGFYVARALFSRAEVEVIGDHYMRLRAEGPKPGDMGGDASRGDDDPLNKFARMINMHDWDERTTAWHSDPRLMSTAARLVGDEVVMCQTMIYFKPPGARGQALHQDNQYLRKYPLIASWVALDDSDEKNGQLVMVPGSHKGGILPVRHADTAVSFTSGESVLPPGSREAGITMTAGDAIFFGGFTIHGSHPNRTTDRFRRSLSIHYYAAHTQELPRDPATMMTELAGAA